MEGPVVSPELTKIGRSLVIPRMINGLWQLAGGHDKDVDIAVSSSGIDHLINAGLDCFDMADHYGDAELVIGYHNTNSALPLTAFTKWCPTENGIKTFENAEDAINLTLSRLNQKTIALLQYHVWDYSDNTWIHNLTHLRKMQESDKIEEIGLTNTDAAHLQMLIDTGFNITTNQVSCSVIDRRVMKGRMNEICLKNDIGLLCYGTLLGGFLSEKWLDQPEPADINKLNWSLRKYLRFIWAAGGWSAFQIVLKALQSVAVKHKVPISAVAIRYVLDIPSVKAVIVGTRLGETSSAYIASNLKAFTFELDKEDNHVIATAQECLKDLPGDCGDEYRRPPYLTAAGDLSHHFTESEKDNQLYDAIAKGQRVEYTSGSKWEIIARYCRAVRVGNTIHVSGTTANSPIPELDILGGSSAASQTVRILDIIENALKALGSCMRDVVRTRILVEDLKYTEEVSRAHGWRFACEGIRPANTLLAAHIVGEYTLVEIEAWAEVGSGDNGVLKLEYQ
ncbi:endoribonuclease l-psp [Fusarium beomiforme]|uniref:Endoribonuclease l-psp n=1 Tax=Fusarium beomiforme TaxID=44412 RepID=A0A9P5AB50_9HYPO|nr:endoribonuclease l-psp [Fusarium beomiforme]